MPSVALVAQRVGLAELIDGRVALLGTGRTASGTTALTVLGTLLVGGDSIGNTAVLPAGATGELFDATRHPRRSGRGCAFRWHNVHQLDASTRSCWPGSGRE